MVRAEIGDGGTLVDVARDEDDLPTAEAIVLRRIGQMEGRAQSTTLTEADYARLCALVAGQVVSTGDEFEDFEVIEIVPPDEPAFVGEETTVEIA
jgi:hypothetical protein